MLNKFALVVLILQLARAERHAAAQSGPRGPAMESADDGCAPELTRAGCKTCTAAGSDQTCLTCTDSTHNVQLNGKSCAANCPEHSTANQKICRCDDGYSLNPAKTACEPSSTNKSSLSTGAIAGISVAVIAVVGGLVGFLCWWLLCRGKA